MVNSNTVLERAQQDEAHATMTDASALRRCAPQRERSAV